MKHLRYISLFALGAMLMFSGTVWGASVLQYYGGGTGTSTPGIAGQVNIIDPTGKIRIATSSLFVSSAGHVAIGSTTNSNGGLNLIDTNSSLGVGLDSIVLGGNPAGDTDFWFGRYVTNDSTSNDRLQWGLGLIPGTTPLVTLDFLGNLGLGSTSPLALFSAQTSYTGSSTPLFWSNIIGSSTPSLYIGSANQNGYIGFGSTSPSSQLSFTGNTGSTTGLVAGSLLFVGGTGGKAPTTKAGGNLTFIGGPGDGSNQTTGGSGGVITLTGGTAGSGTISNGVGGAVILTGGTGTGGSGNS